HRITGSVRPSVRLCRQHPPAGNPDDALRRIMNWIRLSINQPVLIIMIECFLVTLGLLGLGKLGMDLYPEVDPPVITITTEYPGAGTEETEHLISKPIEEQVNQLGRIEKIQSASPEGLSQVVIEFQLNIDAQQANIDVTDKLSQVR